MRGFLLIALTLLLLPMTVLAADGGIKVWQEAQSKATKEGAYLAIDQASWVTLWQQLGRAAPLPNLPDDKFAAGIMLGQKKSAGYTVELYRVEEDDMNVVVNFRVREPSATANVAQVMTAPYAVVLFNKTDKQVRI